MRNIKGFAEVALLVGVFIFGLAIHEVYHLVNPHKETIVKETIIKEIPQEEPAKPWYKFW